MEVPAAGGEPWFKRAFGRYYPLVYPHRDAAEAQAAVAALHPLIPPGPVLDMACGAGRHLAALARAGRRAVGLDLSPELLALARRAAPGAPLVRGDMRLLPFLDGAFSGVLSMFSSFGYFETEEEDAQVLAGAGRVLRPGGILALDLPNPALARASDGVATERRGEGILIQEARRVVPGGRRVEKRVVLRGLPDGGVLDEYTETLRLYEAGELEAHLRRVPLELVSLRGNYAGEAFGPRSGRLIAIARRKDPLTGEGGDRCL